jgi:hypothetical protein
MDNVDDDIEFDFFEDDATTEAPAPSRVRLPRRPSGPSRRLGPPRGVAPLVRLLLLVAFVVFLVLVFGLLIQSCASASKHDAYAHYMSDVSTIASQSQANGKAVVAALTTSGLSSAQLENKLRGIADQEQQNVAQAENLNPPGRLRVDNTHIVEALELRVSGVEGLVTAFQKVSQAKDKTSTEDAQLLADQGLRLTASDVVWDDLFKSPAQAQLQHDGVSGVDVPESHFVANPDLMTTTSMALVLQRIGGAASGAPAAGLHGTNIGVVMAEPGGQALSADNLTTVTATTDLAFSIDIHNGGDFQEVQIPVTLTIPQSQGGPLTKTQTIDLINPGQDVTLTFHDVGSPPFASQTTIKVDVKAVRGESNLTNNSTSYPVIFSLP